MKTTSRLRAMFRGLRGRCPNCGDGRMFRAYLKVAESCPACAEELHHHRADDFPAYVVLTILGHVLIPTVVAVELAYSPPYLLQLAVWLPTALILVLGLLQPVKGAIVGLHWSLGLHGFETAKDARETTREASAVSAA